MNFIGKILAAAAIALGASQAMAQDFEVSPVNFLFNAAPGTMQTREITITNHSNSASVFRLRVEDYDIDEEGYLHTRARGMVRYSCTNWVSISPSTLNIDPNSQGVARITMSVPADGAESRWCQIVVSEAHERTSLGADNSNGAGVILSPEIVVNVEQTPKDFRDARAFMSSFVEAAVEGDTSGSRFFAVTVENQGKTILNGTLYVVAANMETLQEFDILKRGVSIMTGATMKYRLELKPGTLPDGIYDVTCLLDMGPSLPLKGGRLKEQVTVGSRK